jgi:hypothetical protein
MKYTVDTASDGIIYIPSFMTIGSRIQVILRSLPQQFERIQCWYYTWMRFTKYAGEMASEGPIGLGIQVKLKSLPQQSDRL